MNALNEAIPSPPRSSQLLLKASERLGTFWLVALLTLVMCVSSVFTCWVLSFVWPLHRMNYVLSAIIPAVVAPPLEWSWIAMVRKLSTLSDQHQILIQQARADAEIDQLTGVYNRRGLFNRAESIAPGAMVGVVDIDRFKAVNDSWGHAVGDAALVAVADELRRMCAASPDESLVARSGGDEFVVAVNQGAALPTSLRIPMPTDAVAEPMLVSIGWSRHEGELDETLARADAAMYGLKQSVAVTQRMPSEDYHGAHIRRQPARR